MFFDRLRVDEDLERIKKRFKEQYDTPAPAESSESSESSGFSESSDSSDFSESFEPVQLRTKASESTALNDSVDSVELEALHSGIAETVQSFEPVQSTSKNDDKIGAKDFFAMVIAVFSLLLPFLITMLVVMGLFLLFFFRSSIF